ncbi:MAG: hypothetical protein IKP06_01155 [Elusimicrobiaceae bacterium]|nr:hypothetical protein [Elusimicrobiaceae bacterium]
MSSSYKKYAGIILLCCPFLLQAQETEPEIVIELTGEPSPVSAKDEISVWTNDCAQLAKLLRGQTCEKALYSITSVSSQDRIIPSSDGTRFRFVQYGQGDDSRRFLFLAKDPQLFVACASNAQETLSLISQYRVPVGLSVEELLAFEPQATSVPLPFPEDKQLLYKVDVKDKEPLFLLFKAQILHQILTPTEADRLLQQQKEALAAQTQKPEPPKPAKKKVFRALVEGGTLHDQMFMPHVIKPSHSPVSGSETAPASPSPAGAVRESSTENYDKI